MTRSSVGVRGCSGIQGVCEGLRLVRVGVWSGGEAVDFLVTFVCEFFQFVKVFEDFFTRGCFVINLSVEVNVMLEAMRICIPKVQVPPLVVLSP